MTRITVPIHAVFIGIILLAPSFSAGCAHEQGYDIGQSGEPPILPALIETGDESDLSADRFLQLVDRHSWPITVISVPRGVTIHDPSYMTDSRFERDGQPWADHPTLSSAHRAEPGRSDDINALPGELLQAGMDIVAMPFRMIIGPHPHDEIHGPAADWVLLPERTGFDPGWFQPMGTAEAPIPFTDED